MLRLRPPKVAPAGIWGQTQPQGRLDVEAPRLFGRGPLVDPPQPLRDSDGPGAYLFPNESVLDGVHREAKYLEGRGA